MPLQPGSHVYGNQDWTGDWIHEQQSGNINNRPSGYYTTSLAPQSREFEERSEVIQRGGQQASGYYHKSIRNEDARHSNFDMVAEEPSANITDQSMMQSRHPIQRGKTQASGSFQRTIRTDDVNRSDPMTSAQLDPPPRPSRMPMTSEWTNDELQRHQTTNNYYWNFRPDADDVQQVSRRDHQGHMTTSGQTLDANQLASTQVLDRVFEWESTNDGPTNTYNNDQSSPNQTSHHDSFNSNDIANGGHFDRETETPVPGQAFPSGPPVPFHQKTSYITTDRLRKREKSGSAINNIILAGVVVLCVVLAAAAVVILVVAI